MENDQLKERLRLLEDEFEQLKESISPSEKQNRLVVAFRQLNQFFSSYQALLTFIVAILTIVYVQVAYGLDPLDSYSNTATTKKLSEFYRQLGDRLVYMSEYADAESAYKSALTLQPNNTQAVYGLAKAQVFTPNEGQKYSDKGIADAKLDYLLSLYPNDADLYFLKCLNAEYTDNREAKSWCEKAVRLNNKADAFYVELGYLCQKELDLECAITNYKKALELNPHSQIANNNIGYTEFLRLNFQDSVKYLEQADRISPRLVTLMNLGEVHRYLGDIKKAIALHEVGVDIATEDGIEKETIARGIWIVNFLPYDQNDVETRKRYSQVSTINEKKALLYYALSIDYALHGDFETASNQFENAISNDKDNQYGNYFINRCISATRILKVNQNTKNWFKEKNKRVCTSNEICGMTDRAYVSVRF